MLDGGVVDIILIAVERYFGLAPQTHVRRGDGRSVRGQHLGQLGTHRPTGRSVGVGCAANQGRADMQGLEHADYFRPERKVERLDRARQKLGHHNPRYRTASAGTIALRTTLAMHASKSMRRARRKLGTLIFDAADTDCSGRIDRSEFADYIAADPRLLHWLDGLGKFWLELGGIVAGREVAEGVSFGTLGFSGLNIYDVAGVGVPDSTTFLQAAMQPHLQVVDFKGLVRLVAKAPTRLSRNEWVDLAKKEAGLKHKRLAEALWDVWAAPIRQAGATDDITSALTKVKSVELVCGCAMLRLDASSDTSAVTDFTFSLIDCDHSKAIEPSELSTFLQLFRKPIAVKQIQTFCGVCFDLKIMSLCASHAQAEAERGLAGFYRLAVFGDVYRPALTEMLDMALNRSIAALVSHAFASDDNNDDKLSRAEFRSWAKLNSNVTQWVASLSSFVLNNINMSELIKIGELSD